MICVKKRILRSFRPKIGLTMGDPSGIGPEIIAAALKHLKVKADIVIIGDRKVFKTIHYSSSPINNKFEFIDLNNVNYKNFMFGKVNAEYGRASIEYLDEALRLIKDKRIDCLVTCPISKESINLAGFKYGGHTEYLTKKTGTKDFVMMLLNNKIRISLVTRHIPIRKVSSIVNQDALRSAIRITFRSLKSSFNIPHPRLAVCGLNPHASDNGVIGDEENRVIKPVIREFRLKFRLDGPESADVIMLRAVKGEYDAVIAMYHDQALIALKLSGYSSGVNITLGLPFVRTSPLHGTAFDIAGKGEADPSSLIAAIKLAFKCCLNQREKKTKDVSIFSLSTNI
ncbi:MAG: 4-hydroxythreonine-4-phosphate dehydrogenase PdxA [Candidatus Omnitrophota bacterium]|nr:4-hydroxythreonine-4-phosphate dehydrogenase PdxA [Candidatus Omnitrophota bacterium]MBU1929193.1 4-hydroxythreonine-4-phosphate dehydrogenase PdxA [Candidatus Omnitrophota bacterium]MBU2035484.1 4-hydroxythreonine-4-phosphate dehydrogenase PdxA [Candidatus Omnitrophota bacterium]MBU2221608.1 4-hydroxythreonine-4-phosphate dehydrogenase PdxA [Candidatus Omnitrophota bacterium]